MHPILIVGAVLVGLPILLHLIMKQEPKRLLFPAVRLLKQKRKINQRKMRLRHLLLLLLRMLLIALFALALFQPRIPSSGLNLGLTGDQPVAAVFVLDTSPSMGYIADNKTRLDEARRRALELLAELPDGSKVAVLDPADPAPPTWEPSVGDARRKIEAVKEPHGGAPPLTTALFTAYQLLKTVDQESDSSEPLPRLVAVFSDRAAECWKADRTDDLKRAAADVPPPAVAHVFVDVGADQPADVAVTSVEARPQIVPAGQSVTLTVTVLATGPDVPDAAVRCNLDNATTERKQVALSAGTPTPVPFTFKELKAGVHQAEVSLETPDKLTADNVRYVTFRVGESRKLLTITDDPGTPDQAGDAWFWQLAHQSKGEFGCDVKKPADVTDGDLGRYDAVCLLNVADPSQKPAGGESLWDKLRGYVEKGGRLLVMPGEHRERDAYDAKKVDLLPATLDKVIDTAAQLPPPRSRGVAWDLKDDKALQHPLLEPFKQWKLQGNVDFLRNPRLAWKYWEVSDAASENVIVYYDDADDPKDRHPAVLEKSLGAGKVVLLTTRMDPQFDQKWNNYWETAESSWPVVFPNLLARYLAGDTAEPVFNFATGQAVPVPLPKGDALKGKKIVLEGPGVSGPDARPQVGEKQPELRLPPGRTLTAGNYLLRTEDRSWQEGFSLNPPAEEFNLTKVPKEAIEAVFGPDTIIPVEKDLKLGDTLQKRFDPEVRLFPWLLIAVLLLIAAEGFVANRFYRLRR